MLPPKCLTCHMLLADKQIQYERILDKICLDCETNKLTKEEGDELKKKLVNSLGLDRYCCHMRTMTYSRLINIVK